MTDVSRSLSAISLFSGAGGMDLGFHQTGRIRTLACYEFNSIFAQTLRMNREALRFRRSVSGPDIQEKDLSNDDVIQEMHSLYGNPDIIYGGPPCQSFSIMGKKGGIDDPRGALIFAFLKAVETLSPKAFLFENVPNFSTIQSGAIAKELMQDFAELGYSLWSGLLCAADFGAHTFRRRFFILGVKGQGIVAAPVATHSASTPDDLFETSKKPWRTCREVFQEIEASELAGRQLANHDKVKHSAAVIERFSQLRFGETDHIRKRNRLDPSRPAHSVYVGGKTGKLQARTHIHPYLPRELTARECAAIQGFPLTWEFAGRSDAATLQAANAVPVQLARELALTLAKALR